MALDPANVLSRIAGPSALASGTSTVFTGSASHIYTVKKIKIVNTDVSNSKTVQLFINGSATGNAVTPVMTIDAGGWAESDDFMILSGTDTLQATTSATGLTITVFALDQN